MARWIAVEARAREVQVWVMNAQELVAGHSVCDIGSTGTAADMMRAIHPLIEPYLSGNDAVPVLVSGMSSAPAVPVPAAPPAAQTGGKQEGHVPVHVLPALTQARPPDRIGPEVAQIAGFISANADWDGVVCLVGQRTVWAHLSAGEVVSFRSFMTPEIFSLLSDHSSLAHSVQTLDWDAEAFTDALGDAMSRPENLASSLSCMQAEQPAPRIARARLSGLLIGMELAAARPYWLGQNLAVVGSGPQAAQYQAALTGQGVPVRVEDGDEMRMRGFHSAYKGLK